MTPGVPDGVQVVLDRWAAAELAGDSESLDTVLHAEFRFVGPYGYVLDRRQWLGRFDVGDRHATTFTSFAFSADVGARVIGDTALVVGTQSQTGTHQGEVVDGYYRATLVLVRDPGWLLAGIHLSLPQPP